MDWEDGCSSLAGRAIVWATGRNGKHNSNNILRRGEAEPS